MIEKIRNNQTLLALRGRRTLSATLIVSVLVMLYWGVVASDRYVSEAHVIVQTTDVAYGQDMELSTLLGGLGGAHGADQLLLRDHLLSVDMLNKLDAKLQLRAHYSDGERDVFSRMWADDVPLEGFHKYYLSRVSVELDERAGVLVIKAQAYDPTTAHAITAMLVEEGERFMNTMAHRLAEGQVQFLEKQVISMSERAIQSRQALLDFQDKEGLVSPENTAENLAGIINGLQTQLADLQARRSAMLGYLMDGSADVIKIDQQIAAIEKQIAREQVRLTSKTGPALNEMVERYQRLQLNAEFAQGVYKSALVALEKGRIEATRMLKKVSVLQTPTMPQYALEPRRLYNTIVFILVTLLIAGIGHLIAAIVRDHKD